MGCKDRKIIPISKQASDFIIISPARMLSSDFCLLPSYVNLSTSPVIDPNLSIFKHPSYKT
jgi:hypothetical protein